MRRREFILLVVSAMTAARSVRAQQEAIPVIGFLSARAPAPHGSIAVAFRQGLSETGYVEGRNVAIEYRWADGRFDRLPALSADLVRHPVSVIVAISGTPAALAAKAATTAIPIVFANGGDPITSGLVTQFNRPTGNITGVTFFSTALVAKRLQLMRDLLQKTATIGYLMKPNNPAGEAEAKEATAAAASLGLRLLVLPVVDERDIDAAFATFPDRPIGALLVGSDPLFFDSPTQLVALAARYRVPTMYFAREFTEGGGLLSYGSIPSETYRQAGIYVGKILQGSTPGDLPVMEPTKFELVINLKTAKALGLTVPQSLFARADEVIE